MSDVKDDRRMTTSVVLEDGKTVEIMQLKRRPPYSKYGSMKKWNSGTRIYVGEVGESVFENLNNRFGRPVNEYRAAVLEALTSIGITDHKVAWSQKAGCSCGCSPGFILRVKEGVVRHVAEDGFTPVDIYVSIAAGSLGESKSRNIFTASSES
jgi:hypothetical protein